MNARFLRIPSVTLFALVLISAPVSSAVAQSTYGVVLTATPPGSGTVSKDPNQPSYPAGTQVTLTAIPATGYAFSHWSGDASGTSNPLTVTMDGPKNITANFIGHPLNVTSAPNGSGTVTRSPDQATYAPGSQVTLTASTSPFPFQGWTGAASGMINPVTLTMDGAKDVTANFEAYGVTSTVTPAGTGTVSQSPDQGAHPPNSIVMLTANPVEGFVFTGWSDDLTGTTNPIGVQMDADKFVTANFAPQPPGCGAWSPMAALPFSRVGTSAVWDPVRHRILLFGGANGPSFFNDVWQLTAAGGWAQLLPAGTPPSPRDAAGMVYEPTGDRLIVFGGNNNGGFLNDLWELSLSGTPTWTPLTPTGTPPFGRFEFSAIHDTPRNRMIVFGGLGGGISQNDTWALSLTGIPSWSLLSPGGALAGRYGHVAIYDAARDRMLVHGGTNTANVHDDVWALSLAGTPTWTLLTPHGQWPRRYESAAIYDPVRDRMLVVAGRDNPIQGGVTYDEVWSLSLEVQPMWRQVDPTGMPLGGRFFFSAVWEPDLDLLVAIGGLRVHQVQPPTDCKRLDMAGGFWLETGGDHGTVAMNPSKNCYENGEVVTLHAVGSPGFGFQQWLGDASGNSPLVDVTMNGHKSIVAQFQTSQVGVDDGPVDFALGRIHPNPGPGAVTVDYSLVRAGRMSLRVFDIAGREVAQLAAGVRQSGKHTARWDGMAGGVRARSGVYVVRFETLEGSWSRRFVLIR